MKSLLRLSGNRNRLAVLEFDVCAIEFASASVVCMRDVRLAQLGWHTFASPEVASHSHFESAYGDVFLLEITTFQVVSRRRRMLNCVVVFSGLLVTALSAEGRLVWGGGKGSQISAFRLEDKSSSVTADAAHYRANHIGTWFTQTNGLRDTNPERGPDRTPVAHVRT
jgi:hypothetical protein